MGCASSKPIKKQPRREAGMPLPCKTSPDSRTFNSDIEDYHRHLLALTSSSRNAVATVDSPKTAETGRKDGNAAGHMDSLNDMFDKLGTLESAESVPKSWKEVSGMLETLKSVPTKENYRQPEGLKVCPTDFYLLENTEAIDVGDIMKGLEDETPRGSSASQNADSPATLPGPSLLLKAFGSSQHIMEFDEANVPIHTVDELDARFGIYKDSGVGQVSKDSLKNAAKKSQIHAIGLRATSGRDGSEKENAKPPGSENSTMLGRGMVPSKTALRSPFVPPQVISKSSSAPPHVAPVMGNESNANRTETTEDIFLSKDVSIFSSTGLTSTPVPEYSVSSRKEKLVFNLENQKNIFTGTAMSGQTASTLDGSLSERSLMTERGSYFDPELLTSYEKALQDHSEEDWNALQVNNAELHQNVLSDSSDAIKKELITSIEEKRVVQVSQKTVRRECSEVPNLFSKTMMTRMEGKLQDPFEKFEEKCPPGGEKTVVLYTTTLRGIRKTFEDCNNVREILQSFGLSIDQRDVSMHLQFRNELLELMGRIVSVPRLFIKGRYIGGREDVAKLHENAKLSELIEGLPKEITEGNCDGCGGMRFIPCLECSGSCKIVDEGKVVRCPYCNENGLIQCPICS